MKALAIISFLVIITLPKAFAQDVQANARLRQLRTYEDSLRSLGTKFINDSSDMVRKTSNYTFIRTLVSALKITGSYNYPFDSVKSISIVKSPDNHFRILTWNVMNYDGSYRFYGAIQMNNPARLQLYPLEDYSPLLKNPEDSVVGNTKWYGAHYYKIIAVGAANPYYVLLGWKGNTTVSTKKVIDVLSFTAGKPMFGLPVFTGNNKTRKRVVFEYTRQASMLLRYVAEQSLIVFDHLAPPEPKLIGHFDTYGPDLTYSGYKLNAAGYWVFVDNLDMRNVPDEHDVQYIDPKSAPNPKDAARLEQ